MMLLRIFVVGVKRERERNKKEKPLFLPLSTLTLDVSFSNDVCKNLTINYCLITCLLLFFLFDYWKLFCELALNFLNLFIYFLLSFLLLLLLLQKNKFTLTDTTARTSLGYLFKRFFIFSFLIFISIF